MKRNRACVDGGGEVHFKTAMSLHFGLFPFTITVTTRGNRNFNNPLIRPLFGWGNDPTSTLHPETSAPSPSEIQKLEVVWVLPGRSLATPHNGWPEPKMIRKLGDKVDQIMGYWLPGI